MKSTGATIIGLGAQTAVGRTALASAAAVRAGVPRIGEHPSAFDGEGEPLIVGMASYLSELMPIEERLVELARAAASEALLPVAHLADRVDAIVGLPAPRLGLPADLEGLLAAELPVEPVQAIVAGHSAGLLAIRKALALLGDGTLDICLAGGVDCYLDEETLSWLIESRQASSRSNPWGFVPGEGAGFCLLASKRFMQQHPNLRRLGDIRSAATAREKHLIRTDSVCTGEGLTAAWKGALSALPTVAQVICDLNGEPYRADELGFTLLRLGKHLDRSDSILVPSQYWGDVGAASGPLFVCLAIAAGLRGSALGPHCLISTSSESGERAAAVVDVLKEKPTWQ